MIWMILGAILIGVSLGLMGSGGSILTVPVLVYVLGHDKNLAVAESLAIVGIIAMVAAVPNIFIRQVHWKSVLFFGIPGMLGTVAGAWIGVNWFSGAAKLLMFSLVMLVAAWLMFRKKADPRESDVTESESESGPDSESDGKENYWKLGKISLEGTVVGIVTGIVGVGGGFLIVPALVLLGGLSMRQAVGTSLLIIALKSMVGFLEYQYEFTHLGLSVDWQTIAVFSILGAAGSFVGRYISKSIDQSTLRKVFAVVLVLMAILILAREAPQVFGSQQETVSHLNINEPINHSIQR